MPSTIETFVLTESERSELSHLDLSQPLVSLFAEGSLPPTVERGIRVLLAMLASGAVYVLAAP